MLSAQSQDILNHPNLFNSFLSHPAIQLFFVASGNSTLFCRIRLFNSFLSHPAVIDVLHLLKKYSENVSFLEYENGMASHFFSISLILPHWFLLFLIHRQTPLSLSTGLVAQQGLVVVGEL